jgi:hypothetical protein
MTPKEIAEAICKMRNPLRIKATPKEFRYNDNRFKTRVEKIDRRAAAVADAKELEEVWQ